MTTAPLGPSLHEAPESPAPPEPAAPPHPEPPPVARLAIAPPGPVVRRIDGAWWPHSTDLLIELPELLQALPFDWPRITHATVNGAVWSALPSRILVADHVVRLRRTRIPRPGPDTVCLVAAGHGRWDLLIIAPETPEAEAVAAMARMTREGAAGAEPG
ncbi:DUF5994 family protein [Streptomyces gilvosporeus]|uniref:Uncharacterized protein n=1 Tax=Streptomyces gilvosporeus TaxID=553510 RepID=A0A1V0TTH5_9ACTN|nr:DUF5994 family protein [Streptomyces gilvosporeus]ARF56259.1 hypothetical protein B1H19_20590 [Streptomyces gilvosporeus]